MLKRCQFNYDENFSLDFADFQREQMKITYVDSSRSIRVQGERPVAYNKWSRFNQSFPVPQNCQVNKIQGKFQNGVLIITMPKTTITQPKKEAKSPKEASIPPQAASTSIDKEGNEKQMTPQTPQKATIEPKAQKGLTDPASFGGQKQTEGKKVEALSPQEVTKEPKSQKGQDVVPQKVASTKDTLKQKDENSEAISTKVVVQKTIERRIEAIEKPTEPVKDQKALFDEQEESGKKRKEAMITESEEISKKRKESMISGQETAAPKTLEKEKDKNDKFVGFGEEKPDHDFNIAEKVKELKNIAAAAAKKTAKGFTMELSEERQSLVNMGVAVLVIVALGAYIAYSYRSYGNPRD